MPITDQTLRVAIAEIQIDRANRQRREIETADLEASISKFGLIEPIIVERQGETLWLRAGERRLTACLRLGHEDILVRFAENLSESESQIIELEENIKRKDLCWQDYCQAVSKIHRMYKELDDSWEAQNTAEQLSITQGHLSALLSVAAAMGDEKIFGAGTMREAYNIILRREKRVAGDQLQELLEINHQLDLGEDGPFGANAEGRAFQLSPDPDEAIGQITDALGAVGLSIEQELREQGYQPPQALPAARPAPASLFSGIAQGSFLDWVQTYSGPKFNFVHCDFPYGINVFNGPQGRGAESGAMYEDGEDIYWALLDSFLRNRDRFMSISCHLVFWYSNKHYQRTMAMFSELAPELTFRRHPLIWVKSDNTGIIADARRDPRHVYETALMAERGDRFVLKSVADAYSGPVDKSLHPSTKPEPMLRHFLSMMVDENTLMLDPTAGSGASLRAADSLGAKHCFGLELDPEYQRVSQQAFEQSRKKRSAAAKAAELGL